MSVSQVVQPSSSRVGRQAGGPSRQAGISRPWAIFLELLATVEAVKCHMHRHHQKCMFSPSNLLSAVTNYQSLTFPASFTSDGSD
jgi:hypothetical protein